jgi:hypothetical protein
VSSFDRRIDACSRCDGLINARINALSVRQLGGGCRLYDGSEEAVACTTAGWRLTQGLMEC